MMRCHTVVVVVVALAAVATPMEAHTSFFRRVLPAQGIDFDPDMATIFRRFDVLYQER
jgi:uncharacterized protein YhfF